MNYLFHVVFFPSVKCFSECFLWYVIYFMLLFLSIRSIPDLLFHVVFSSFCISSLIDYFVLDFFLPSEEFPLFFFFDVLSILCCFSLSSFVTLNFLLHTATLLANLDFLLTKLQFTTHLLPSCLTCALFCYNYFFNFFQYIFS